MPPAIETRDLGKVFSKKRTIRDLFTHPFRKPGTVRALEGVSFSVERGEIFGLLGPNGAGKTTLLKILSCLITPTTGNAFVNGHDAVARDHQVKASIGLVTSDERSFYWRLSGRENLRFFAALYGVPAHRVKARCEQLLGMIDLAAKGDQPFMEYSTGMKQRLAVARALLHDPPILFMDEPTRSLDPTAAKNLREFVSGTLNRREGKTIILATHNLPEAESLCHRLAILHLARIRRLGTMREVRSAGSTTERYALVVLGVAPERLAGPAAGDRFLFDGCRIDLPAADAEETEEIPAGALRVRAELSPGGGALTELLRRLLAAGATIISCARRESSLQEIFDLVASEGPDDAAERELQSARLRSDPAEREWAR